MKKIKSEIIKFIRGGGQSHHNARNKICATLAIILSLSTPMQALAVDSSEVRYDVEVKQGSLGKYEFFVKSHEIPSNEVLPIIDKSYFPVTTKTLSTEIDNTAPGATYEARPATKVDIIFAFGNTTQSTAMQNLIKTLEARVAEGENINVDVYAEKVETSTIDSNDAGARDIFDNWENYPDDSGQWTFDSSNNSMGSTRNVAWTGFWDNREEAIKTTDVTIEYKSKEVLRVSGTSCLKNYTVKCHPDPMGWTFRMTNKDGKYSYYAFSIYAYQQVATLARINDAPSPNNATQGVVSAFGGTISNFVGQVQGHVKQLGFKDINYNPVAEHSIKIECHGKSIVIWYDGTVLFNVTDNDVDALTHGGYGPFTYSTPNGNFYDIKITKGSEKSLGEAVSDVHWRDDSIKFIVYGEDTIPEYMKNLNNAEYLYTVSKLIGSNANLINLGTLTNKNVLQQLVRDISTASETKGTFFLNSNISQAMNNAADWIIEKIRNLSKPTNWILVNTEVDWFTQYTDYERDVPLNFGEHDGTKNKDTSDKMLSQNWGVGLTHLFKEDKIHAEKWRYRHFNLYYDNSPVKEGFHNNWISEPVEIFPYPGKYRINYKRKDNPFHTDVNLEHLFKEYRKWSDNYDPLLPFG